VGVAIVQLSSTSVRYACDTLRLPDERQESAVSRNIHFHRCKVTTPQPSSSSGPSFLQNLPASFQTVKPIQGPLLAILVGVTSRAMSHIS